MCSRQPPRQSAWRKLERALSLRRRSRVARFAPAILLALGLALFSCLGAGRSASARSVVAGPKADVVVLNSEINAASQNFILQAIHKAERDGARVLVLEINTPGGAIDSLQAITSAELTSTVPIISYVTPTGAYAASAGALVTLAAPIAAMAPATTIGASSPVNGDGSNLNSTERAKVESVLTTMITNMQQRYGRNVDLAVKMVTSAASYSDQQARAQDIIDIEASSLGDLLNQANGHTVTLADGQQVTLQTAGASVQAINASPADNLYSLLVDPNVIFLLFVIALIGIYVEISHPGLIAPGVIGSIALLLFFFGVGSLSPNWAGLALMGLAFVLLVMDVRLTTHGVLTVGAVISLVTGALLFFNSGGPYQGTQVNPLIVYLMGVLIGGLGFYVVTVVVRTRRMRVTTGTEGMIGERVTALTDLLPQGRVSYGGENWSAVLEPPTISVDAGSELRIISVEGLLLHVQLATKTLPPADRKYSEGV